jgi:hypothetical protein
MLTYADVCRYISDEVEIYATVFKKWEECDAMFARNVGGTHFTCFTGTREQMLTLRAASPGPKLTYLEFEQLCRDVVGSGEEGLKTEQVSS